MNLQEFCKYSNLPEPNLEIFDKISSSLKIIDFYDINNSYYEFSNYYKSNIVIDNKQYSTVEHYFQSSKFSDPYYSEIIRNAKTSNIARILARQEKVEDINGEQI